MKPEDHRLERLQRIFDNAKQRGDWKRMFRAADLFEKQVKLNMIKG